MAKKNEQYCLIILYLLKKNIIKIKQKIINKNVENDENYISNKIEKKILENIDYSRLKNYRLSTKILIKIYIKLLLRLIKYYGYSYNIRIENIKKDIKEILKLVSKKEKLEFQFFINYVESNKDEWIEIETYHYIVSTALWLMKIDEIEEKKLSIMDYYKKIIELENKEILENF